MRRVTLRMPESLFHQLELMAQYEGVSLNQFLVYSLTRNASRGYQPIPVPPSEIERQKKEFNSFIESFDQTVTDEEFQAFLDSGEPADDDDKLDPELEAKLNAKIAEARAKRTKTT